MGDLPGIIFQTIRDTSPSSVLFIILTIGFTLLITVFNYRSLKRSFSDYHAFLVYFGSFFIFLCLIPALFILLFTSSPLEYLGSHGLRSGGVESPLPLLLIGTGVVIVISLLSVRDPAIQKQYPFSKGACRSLRGFLAFELAYLLLYYFSWEFVFRGILLFSLLETGGPVVAIAVQTMLSTVYHIGHPDSEIWGALAGGVIFGLIAVLTGSILYSFYFHALLGITNDTLLCLKRRKKGSASS